MDGLGERGKVCMLRFRTIRSCALCPDLIFPTQPVKRDQQGAWVHAICLEMQHRKEVLWQTVKAQTDACPLCGAQILPQDIYADEHGLRVSYLCEQPVHDKPHAFTVRVMTPEAKQVGLWEVRLRERFREKGYVRCCECGRQILAQHAQSLGPGWYSCGCLPDARLQGRAR